MIKKVDATFYDIYTYEEEPPSIKLSSNNFYGGFALEHPITYDVFIDEEIYIPKAYFKKAERKGNDFEWTIIEIELETCKLEKFGSFYQDIFKLKPLKNYYCFKDIDFILEGHFSYDLYSIFIQFFPCVNTTENHNCKPIEEIDFYLKNTFISFLMENIELTPKDYHSPVRARAEDIYSTVGNKLYKEVYTFFQIVKIETDMDFFGFDEFEKFKTETYLKYDETVIMSNIQESNIYETGEPFCDFTIKLSETVRTERRTYTKLITILGDVGGFMEVLFTLFRIISSFSVEILYEISLVNKLFDFNLDKKLVILKENNSIKENEFAKEEQTQKYYPPKKKKITSHRNWNINEDGMITTDYRINEENLNENKKQFKFSTFKKIKKNSNRGKSNSNINLQSIKFFESIRKTNTKEGENPEELNKNNIKTYTLNNHKENDTNKRIVNKIRLNRACVYLCFCFTRKRKSIQNILLNEGMNIITKRLDIFNLFHKLYGHEKKQEKVLGKNIIEMSAKGKAQLKSLFYI